MVSCMQIVYIYYLQLNMLLNIYFMHSDYFFMDNLLPQSLYPLIMVIIVKNQEGETVHFIETNLQLILF